MEINKTGYVLGVTETYLAYTRRISQQKQERVERQEPAEYKVNPIEETRGSTKYDSRGNIRKDGGVGNLINELA